MEYPTPTHTIMSNIFNSDYFFNMEKLFDASEALKFQQTTYPTSSSLNKTHFNRTIQECLINRRSYTFSEGTLSNFEKVLTFLEEKLEGLKG